VHVNETEKLAVEFQAGVRDQAGGGPRNRYTEELRELAARYWQARKTEGATLGVAAGELGIHVKSLRQWSRAAGVGSPSFRRVEVVPEKAVASRGHSGIVLHAPGGVRVEGLDVDSLAVLLRRLGC
jgi:hypothetical protein